MNALTPHDAPRPARPRLPRTPTRHHRPARRGFVLLEALLAATLLTGGATGLARVQARLALADEHVSHQGEALWLARSAIEQAHLSFSVPSQTWAGSATTFQVQGTATDVPAGGIATAGASTDPFPLRAAQVSVQWIDRTGQRQSLELQTLLSTADPAFNAWLTHADR